jgi:hypothetical protein
MMAISHQTRDSSMNKSSPHGGFISEGTVICGTLAPLDLLRAFSNEYERVLPFNSSNLVFEARECMQAIIDGADEFELAPINIAADEIIIDLMDALNGLASREGLFFGPHEGDGADIGYWALEMA